MHHHSNIEFYNKVVLCCFEYIVYNQMLIIFQVAFQRKLSKTSMKMPLSIFAPYKKLKDTCGMSTAYLISLNVIERGSKGRTIPRRLV